MYVIRKKYFLTCSFLGGHLYPQQTRFADGQSWKRDRPRIQRLQDGQRRKEETLISSLFQKDVITLVILQVFFVV